MGRFEFVPGVEKEDSPVYRQANDIMTPKDGFASLSRSGNEWQVRRDGSVLVFLKASVGDDPTIPPTTGWRFLNIDTLKDEEDQHLTCKISSASSSCRITVSLKGLAKEILRGCEGEYEETDLECAGKTVHILGDSKRLSQMNLFKLDFNQFLGYF